MNFFDTGTILFSDHSFTLMLITSQILRVSGLAYATMFVFLNLLWYPPAKVFSSLPTYHGIMRSIYAGCHLLVYPGAFNTITGPLHWELLLRGRYVIKSTWYLPIKLDAFFRAVDNQVYFSMCSPARDLSAAYHAVSTWSLRSRFITSVLNYT